MRRSLNPTRHIRLPAPPLLRSLDFVDPAAIPYAIPQAISPATLEIPFFLGAVVAALIFGIGSLFLQLSLPVAPGRPDNAAGPNFSQSLGDGAILDIKVETDFASNWRQLALEKGAHKAPVQLTAQIS